MSAGAIRRSRRSWNGPAEQQDVLFNPYTGEALGPSITSGEQFILWLARLHDELLFEREGRWWNGFFSGVFTLLVVTGIVVWWPGIGRWKRSLGVKLCVRLEALQLGPAQRARLLAVPVHADVGRLRLVSGDAGAGDQLRRLDFRPGGLRTARRRVPRLAGAAALRPLSRQPVLGLPEGDLGGRRPGPGHHVRDRCSSCGGTACCAGSRASDRRALRSLVTVTRSPISLLDHALRRRPASRRPSTGPCRRPRRSRDGRRRRRRRSARAA